MTRRTSLFRLATPLLAVSVASPALGGDAGTLAGHPLRVDVTETSVLAYHGDNRNDQSADDVEHRIDDNYGEWLNRFNVIAAWQSWQAGVRLDTATYFHRPETTDFYDPLNPQASDRRQLSAERLLTYRYRDQYFTPPGVPSKYYVTYATPDVEATAGDGYVSFGRGLVLSMRKIDELAVDTSLQGGKVVARIRPVTLTLACGIGNPVRVDEATGVTLRDAPASSVYAGKVWSQDLIVGARAETKLGTSTLGIHAADVHRLASLGYVGDPTIVSRDVEGAGASVAIPRIARDLPIDFYTEVAVQHRVPFDGVDPGQSGRDGYAAYASTSAEVGLLTASLEGKHYRGFYPIKANADPTLFSPFRAVQYNAPPTIEAITQDSLLDNSCTTGGRARIDARLRRDYMLFGSVGYFANWGEQSPTACGASPTLGITPSGAAPRNDIWDAFTGFELRSVRNASSLIMQGGVRRDDVALGSSNESAPRQPVNAAFYRETYVQFEAVTALPAGYSLELTGRHRKRYELGEHWNEGDDVLAFKYGSRRSVFVGHEYTSEPVYVKRGAFLQSGNYQHFVNVGGQVRFGDTVTVRLFVGEQRGALKCVSGVCRQFPPFEGARAEVVVRY